MLNVIITVDCDFAGYDPFNGRVCFRERAFFRTFRKLKKCMQSVDVRPVLLIHTSPYIRRYHGDLFYNNNRYLDLWREFHAAGYEFGIHPHEEEPDGSCYYYYYAGHMKKVILQHTRRLNDLGIGVPAVRMGFFTLSETCLPILEQAGIRVSFDNMGGYIRETANHFESAPLNAYFYDYDNKEQPGESNVLAVPLGMTEDKRVWQGLVPEANSIPDMYGVIQDLCRRSEGKELFVNLLIHLYKLPRAAEKIIKVIDYLKKYATIVSVASIASEQDEK